MCCLISESRIIKGAGSLGSMTGFDDDWQLTAAAILAHRSPVRQVEAAGLTGLRWIELADYPEV